MDEPVKATSGDWSFKMIEKASDLICLCYEGRISYINNAGLLMLGSGSDATVLGKSLIDFVHPDYSEIMDDLLGGEVEEDEPLPLKFISNKGVEIDAEVLVVSMDGNESDTVIVQAQDITERLRTAETILSSETRYRHLVENALDMICVCKEGEVTYVNAAGAHMLGEADAQTLVGRSLTTLVHPDYREIVIEGLETLADEGGTIPLKFVRVDGDVIDVEAAVIPFGAASEHSFMMEARDITEQCRAAAVLRDSEQRLRRIMDSVAEALIIMDGEGEIQSFNPAAEEIFGYEAAKAIGRNIEIIVPESENSKEGKNVSAFLKTGKQSAVGVSGCEELALREDGTVFPIEIAVTKIYHGEQKLFIASIHDITQRKEAEEEIRRARDELEIRVEERTRELTQEVSERRRAEESLRLAGMVIDNLSEAVVIVDKDFNIVSVNPAFSLISGYPSKDIVGKKPPFLNTLKDNNSLYKKMLSGVTKSGHWEEELWCVRKDGLEYAARISFSAITGEDGVANKFAAVVNDISERKRAEERIYYQANFDALTGLPNRALFHDRLNTSLPIMMRTKRKLALMFIDLDGFKLVNDTLGHNIGDLLLKETADRLNSCIRKGDTVARLGGDEFTIIMPNLLDSHNAPLVGQRILDALAKPFFLRGHEAFVSGSIGITVYPDDAEDAYDLLRNADAAMYKAKDHGKANYQFYTDDLNKEVQERMVLKNGLSKALENGEFELFYQPKLNLLEGTINSAEALMRWTSPELGSISPAKFIPLMEETGQVVEVGEWALLTACRQHKAWLDAGLPHIRIAVNLSARQLRDLSFVKIVENALKETGIGPDGLEIEITESMLMSDSAKAVKALGELHDMGIHVAMDDFGTGYSSLSYLKKFPIDTIKIDQSFVADIATDKDDSEIIRTIINMGQTLNRKIVAEGVEDAEQLSILRDFKCDEIQGYFFSRPLPHGEATKFIREQAENI